MAKNSKVKFSHYLEFVFLKSIFSFLGLFSYKLRYGIIHNVIKFLAAVSSTIPKRIRGGLAIAFPNMEQNDIDKIYKENLKILARMAVDFEEGPRMTEGFMADHFDYEEGEEKFANVCKNGGMLILGHLGNWETNGVAITRLLKNSGVNLYVLAKRQTNLLTNSWIEKTRGAQSIKLIYTDESPRIILSLLKKGNLVAFIADQDAGKNGLFLPFLGKLASTYLGPAVFARNTKVPIHFMWSRYQENGKLVFGTQEITRPNLDPKEDAENWEKSFTYNWVKILESKVLEHPASYFWLHRRWKRQPENPQEVWDFWKKWES
ncbi:MAG: lysophospholipid acyltransferase family protein [Leptospira sp.]|nr:lysophospholipid acyltransferase family protein [Leptospira sp.]